MNQKYFKYENKNNKRLRIKDLLMIFSIFTLCVITIIVTGNVSNNHKKVSGETELVQNEVSARSDAESELTDAPLEAYTAPLTSEDEIAYEILPELKFTVPVDGTVIKPFSPQTLIYSETMDDWRTHNGVDIACPFGSEIISSERGFVKEIKHDINYGHTVTVESDDYTLIYSSLAADIQVTEGQNLAKGDIIGKSSDSCISEICDEPHIHFEMKKNGEYVNPLDYINFN